MKISNIIMQQEAEELDEVMMNHAPSSHSSEPSYDASQTTEQNFTPGNGGLQSCFDTL
jgi:hypothetical protein